MASGLVDLGRLDEAEAELAAMGELAERRGRRSRLAAIARVQGQLSAARRQTDRARAAYTEALRLADSADALEQALAHEAYGRFLRRRGERRAAIERLRDAHNRFAALGAAPFLTRCDDELAACGVMDPTTRAPADALTPQERAVAQLICTGRTNQQAADELVVSVKTIGFHLANVYSKLGVHSRVQLAAALAGQRD